MVSLFGLMLLAVGILLSTSWLSIAAYIHDGGHALCHGSNCLQEIPE